MPAGKRTVVGLDVGTSAVRAAEVAGDASRRVLRRFGQVGLPEGAVEAGEVRDKAAVASALRVLWERGGFSTKRVVVGLGSQRGMVRQVEVPAVEEGELRSAVRYMIGDMLPIPPEQAVVDFAPLPGEDATANKRRVLLAAGQRDVVCDLVSAVEAGGLKVEGVDPSALALMRAAAGPGGSRARGGLEAVVGIGAELVTVAVSEGGLPRFVRTVAFAQPPVELGDPERPAAHLKGRPWGGNGAVATAATPRLETVVNEVRSSLEYLLSQGTSGRVERVLLTGGGAMLAGMTEAIGSTLGIPVSLAEVCVEVDWSALGLPEEAQERARNRWVTAVGLALWGTDPYGRLSLMPAEVLAGRRHRRALQAAGAGGVAVALLLGGASYARAHTASEVSNQIKAAEAQAVVLRGQIGKLGYVVEVPREIAARRALAAEDLAGDIDWTGLMGRISAALPQDVQLASVTMTKTEATQPAAGGPGPAPSSPAANSVIGTLTMSASTRGGAHAVALFIDQVSKVKGIEALWVGSTTNAAGVTQIQATADLTTGALSDRAARLPGGASR